jgi:uncharacterized protein
MSNRLKTEKSPYLLQHADNPVDWYAWSDEAFDKAKREDKPVFLSIGYATCHWCHVMAHESFEDAEVAGLMNDAFVNIKVDREERPDIDNTYMTVCQLLTGHGGWPLTVIMTPEKKPFFAATYIPKESRFNRLGMKDLVPRISTAWNKERQKILHSAQKIATGFSQTLELPEAEQPDETAIRSAFDTLKKRFDPSYGGFSSKPKFPSPHNLLFLLQYRYSFDKAKAAEMADLTLEKMRLGGMYDQIGYGFHRYSTDHKWLLPHFEKMLYDQALLMMAYTEGWRHSRDALFKQTVFQIAEYVDGQLTSDDGAFYSAEDADSEGEEGKFYVWELEEIKSLLDPKEAELFIKAFNFEPDGNFEDEATGRKTGANVPYLKKRPEQIAGDFDMDESDFHSRMENIRVKLKQKRAERIRPELDDKVLSDWNGLMIAALARAGLVFDHGPFVKSAEKAWKFIEDKLIDSDGNLLHRYRDGEAGIPAMADDYAFLIWGLTELFQASSEPDYLDKALSLNDQFRDRFLDTDRGGFYFTPEEGEELLGRQKEIYDGAIPSSNSVMAMNLIRLARLTGRTELEDQADRLFRAFASFLNESPAAATYAMHALIMAVKPSAEIVICGSADDPDLQKMTLEAVLSMKKPYVLQVKTDDNAESLSKLAPYTKEFPLDETVAVYICQGFSCEQPVYTIEAMKELLGS